MKNTVEFKGYRTRVEYDAEKKGFVQQRVAVPIIGLEGLAAGDPNRETPVPRCGKNRRADST